MMRLLFVLCLLAGPALAQDRDPDARIGGWIDRYYGYAYYKAGRYEDALALWLPLAEAGDARAQEFVGILYEEGHGVEQDWEAALNWYEKAAGNGVSTAMYNLGKLHLSGRTGKVDRKAAYQWLSAAADAGDSDAKRELAGW